MVAAPVPIFVGLPVADSVAVWVGLTTIVDELPLINSGAKVPVGSANGESEIVDP